MNHKEDADTPSKNLMYYNQMLDKSSVRKGKKNPKNKKQTAFSAQRVNFADYLLAPDGYEAIVYPLYFAFIPYIVGVIFLFLFIAGGDIATFNLIDTSAFLIVWMIGYEIVATILLVSIFVAFLKYDNRPSKRRPF